jgi:putative oxidoreductase
MSARLRAHAPQALGLLRIVSALLFIHAGLQVLFDIPHQPLMPPEGPDTLTTIAGILELVGGVLLLVGFLTRPTAFILSGMMAVAYWYGHAPMSFWPNNNMGVAAILYCFVFLYIVFAGPGAWSIDRDG